MQLDKTAVQREMTRQGITTKRDLAIRTGLNINTVCNMFRGAEPKLPTITKLAKALRCNPLDLLSEED